jgi:hypothetical protein
MPKLGIDRTLVLILIAVLAFAGGIAWLLQSRGLTQQVRPQPSTRPDSPETLELTSEPPRSVAASSNENELGAKGSEAPPPARVPNFELKYDVFTKDMLKEVGKDLGKRVRETGNVLIGERFDAGLYEIIDSYLAEDLDPDKPRRHEARPGVYSGFRQVEIAKGVYEEWFAELPRELYPDFYELKDELNYVLRRASRLEKAD